MTRLARDLRFGFHARSRPLFPASKVARRLHEDTEGCSLGPEPSSCGTCDGCVRGIWQARSPGASSSRRDAVRALVPMLRLGIGKRPPRIPLVSQRHCGRRFYPSLKSSHRLRQFRADQSMGRVIVAFIHGTEAEDVAKDCRLGTVLTLPFIADGGRIALVTTPLSWKSPGSTSRRRV